MKDTIIDIIPASLASTEEELKLQLEKITPLSSRIHIDYADGEFVDNQTVDWQFLFDLPNLYLKNNFEIHLMAKDPLLLAQEAINSGFSRVIIPIEEINNGEIPIISQLVKKGELFVSINPETAIQEGAYLMSLVEGISIMTVRPGQQGQAFKVEALEKVSQLRQLNYQGLIEVDGSVNLETIDKILEYEVNSLVVGSAIINSVSPKEVFEQLQAKTRGRSGKSI
jgi:pentose-5-phosphate-3-epimerase